MIVRFLLWMFVGTIASVGAFFLHNGFGAKALDATAVELFFTDGLLVGTGYAAISFYREMRRLRALKGFVEQFLKKEELQRIMDAALFTPSSLARAESHKMIRLQRDGLAGIGQEVPVGASEEGIRFAFENEKENITAAFRNWQDVFYSRYDQFQLFAATIGLTLRARSFRTYQVEPQLPEETLAS
jgi:hypothetical protein